MSTPIRLGLTLAALFGWLLSFPLFGPALFATTADQAMRLGLLFVFSHSAGMLLLQALPPYLATSRMLQKGVGATLAVVTLLFLLPLAVPAAAGLISLMGFLSAQPILAWAAVYVAGADRLRPIAIAMVGANLLLALAALPFMPGWATLPVLAGLALAGVLFTPAPPAAGAPARPAPPLPRPQRLALLLPLAAFAVADYFVGGLWYSNVTASAAPGTAWQPAMEALFSATAIALAGWLARRSGAGVLAPLSLSLLGLGLVLAAARQPLALYRGLLLTGLVAGDLFYWNQLGLVGSRLGGRRTFGIGLGASILLIGLANLASGLSPQGDPDVQTRFLLSGAALLFLMLPLVVRQSAPTPVETAPDETADRPDPAADVAAAAMVPELPDTLTPTERQVYEQLLCGANDAEIAAELFISRHTVKFHVRNILHKLGVANRKELLSRLVIGPKAKRS